MISTNKTQPPIDHGKDKYLEETRDKDGKLTGIIRSSIPLKVLTTNNLKPREFNYTPREFPTVEKRETRKVTGGMLTTENLEVQTRIAKRAKCAAALKAIKTKQAQVIPVAEPEKKRGRPKKT